MGVLFDGAYFDDVVDIIKCVECRTEYDQQEVWACPVCEHPSPDWYKEMKPKRKRKPSRRPDTGSLRDLLP